MAFLRTRSRRTKYSPLEQINAKNVNTLIRAWSYHAGEPGESAENTPIVVGDVMYFATRKIPSSR